MKIGIVGQPFSGKTTLFEAIIKKEIDLNNPSLQKNKYIPHIVQIHDERVEKLCEIYNPKKRSPAAIEFVDFMGISEQENFTGFDTAILNGFKLMDAFVIVLRGFELYENKGDCLRELETVVTEFQISDQIIIETRLDRLESQIKKTNKTELKEEQALLIKCKDYLDKEIPLYSGEFSEYELKLIRGFQFLSLKPIYIVINLEEKKWQSQKEIQSYLPEKWTKRYPVMTLCAQIEREIALLDEEDSILFMEEYGIKEPVTDKMVKAVFDLLSYINFFTVGEDEVKAWTIRKDFPAKKAAGVIHSDIERGFIRAEVISYDHFKECGYSSTTAKEKGLWRLEGKEYIVQDGDIINFRFAV